MEFDNLKKILSGNLVVRHFDSRRPVMLLTNASCLFGLGFALGHIEHDKDNKPIFKIVHCGSKGLTPTQQRYSTIELECLAIIWAIQKCHFYLRGLLIFQVYTDHRPLEGVFQKDLISQAHVSSVYARRWQCFLFACAGFWGKFTSLPMPCHVLLYLLLKSTLVWN